MRRKALKFWPILAMLIICTAAARAEEAVDERLTLLYQTFTPQTLIVPAGKKIKLTVVNKDSTASEFASQALDRSHAIPSNGQIYVYIGPLNAGTYTFFDDLHRMTASGKIVAK